MDYSKAKEFCEELDEKYGEELTIEKHEIHS